MGASEKFDLDAACQAFLQVENGSVEQLADWATKYGQGLLAYADAQAERASKLNRSWRDTFVLDVALLHQLGGEYLIHNSSLEDCDPYSCEIVSKADNFNDGISLKLVRSKSPLSAGEGA